jgi:uncharacterized protein (TIGR01777 family)
MNTGRVVVTGATGFIGRAVADELAAAGFEVVALGRDPGKIRSVFGDRVRAAVWDGRTAEGWGELADGALAIINLAGDNLAEGRWTRRKKARILDSRVHAGEAVTEAVTAARVKPRVVIQASAMGIYGSRGDEELRESSSPGTGFLAGVVERWEASTRAVESLGVRRVIVRSALVLGKGGGVLPPMLLPFRFFAGGPVGSGRQWVSWIHRSDEVRVFRFLLERDDLSGVFNAAAPVPLRQKDLCRALGHAMRRPCWLPVPAFAMKLLFGEKAVETLLAGQRVVPERLLQAGFTLLFPAVEDALQDLLGRR